jgi:hypothetical protein
MFPSQDTSPEINEVYTRLMQSKTFEERLSMGLQMAHDGMTIWFERIRCENPSYSPDQIRAKMLREMLRIDPTLYWVKELPVFHTIDEP